MSIDRCGVGRATVFALLIALGGGLTAQSAGQTTQQPPTQPTASGGRTTGRASPRRSRDREAHEPDCSSCSHWVSRRRHAQTRRDGAGARRRGRPAEPGAVFRKGRSGRQGDRPGRALLTGWACQSNGRGYRATRARWATAPTTSDWGPVGLSIRRRPANLSDPAHHVESARQESEPAC